MRSGTSTSITLVSKQLKATRQILRVAAACVLLQAVAYSQSPQTVSVSPDQAGGPAYHPSRVIVKFRGTPAALPGSVSDHALGSTGVHVVGNPPGLSVVEALKRYRATPNVIYAEPDYAVATTATPNDWLWGQQWDMTKIAAPAAWNTQTDASNVIVAVIDTGVDFTHPDLQNNLWTNPANGSHGFTCMNGVCAAGGQDDFGHGTHVAGTIGAVANNSAGIAGINWRASILSCKFLGADGSGSVSDAVLCINQIGLLKQQGFNVRVTSNSWGGGGFSQALKDAMAAVEAAGIINVCAAGNSGLNADMAPMYPGGYDNRGILSVLATDANDSGASFTNYGVASVDIAAPGVSTLSTVPTGTCTLCDPSGYKLLSGTSMATPHVSAVLAALFHLNPALTAYQARDVLLDPNSYDAVADQRGSMSSTGGRLNFQKAIANPLLMAPQLNNFPVMVPVSNVFANAGDTITLTAAASDPDNDPLRMVWSGSNSPWLLGWALRPIFPSPTGSSVSFLAPAVAQTAMAPYSVSVSDGRGGGATALAYATIQPAASAGLPPSGTLTVSPTTGPVGQVVSVNFPAADPEGGPVAWDMWQTGTSAFGGCCFTGSSVSVPLNSADVYRITVQAVDSQLNFSSRQSVVVRIGGAVGTPPIANAVFDKLTGPAPLTVNFDASGSTDPDGTIQNYSVICAYGTSGMGSAGPKGSCSYDSPGTYWIMLMVTDNSGLTDVLSAYAVVTPPVSGSAKAAATVTLSNLTQTYTNATLTPSATTNPPGLAIAWTNAPQTNAGNYAVTATVADPNYQGSASGTFTIQKAAATVVLSNLTQTYTGAALTPSATTNPPGLAIAWTNAPQTNAGSYAVTATVTDLNYTGSASGTFTIQKAAATVVLSNLTQAYTGATLTPSATTNPPGLAIAWTNAPQTNAGSYAVTATVTDPNYTGSASGTFTIQKAAASVTLSNLTQTYTGAALTPSATTNPPGLAIAWTNAPQTNAGSYPVTATVTNLNYTGSASGTFTINPATQVTPPGVSITSPLGGVVKGNPVIIQAAVAKGTNPVARVDFLVNGTVKCSDTAAPYSCSWNAPSAAGKSYQLQAKAYDTAGVSGSSAIVTITR